MRLIRSLAVCALVMILPASMALAAGGKGKPKAQKGIHGKVSEVKKDTDKDTGSITIAVHEKGKGKGTEPVSKKFQVLANTKFEKVTVEGKGKNAKKGQPESASFKDVQEGEQVVIHPLDDKPEVAQKVVIVIHKK
jgi:hypothetical protein